jgi:hypothetical protein
MVTMDRRVSIATMSLVINDFGRVAVRWDRGGVTGYSKPQGERLHG